MSYTDFNDTLSLKFNLFSGIQLQFHQILNVYTHKKISEYQLLNILINNYCE